MKSFLPGGENLNKCSMLGYLKNDFIIHMYIK